MNENLIKEAIKSYKSQGFTMTAEWNAGGDECICVVNINTERKIIDEKENVLPDPYEFFIDENDYEWIDSYSVAISDFLADCIVRELSLPSVGECYHNGSGTIDINENNQIFIQFSAKSGHDAYLDGYYNEKTGKWEDNEVNLEPIIQAEIIEDPFELKKLLHRANVNFSGKINKEKETETAVIIEVVQGDEITLSEEQKSFYKPIINDILLKGLEEFKKLETPLKKAENHYYFASIELEGQLHSDSTLHYKLSPSPEYFENFRDEVAILIE